MMADDTPDPHHRTARQRTPEVPPVMNDQREGAGKVTDRFVTLGSVVAYGLWALGLLMLVFSWLVGDADLATHLGRGGLFLCGAAITATVRIYFVKQNKCMRNAFELWVERQRLDEAGDDGGHVRAVP